MWSKTTRNNWNSVVQTKVTALSLLWREDPVFNEREIGFQRSSSSFKFSSSFQISSSFHPDFTFFNRGSESHTYIIDFRCWRTKQTLCISFERKLHKCAFPGTASGANLQCAPRWKALATHCNRSSHNWNWLHLYTVLASQLHKVSSCKQ